MPLRYSLLPAAFAAAASLPLAAAYVNPDGTGQALLFPFYTVRAAEAGAFNTYLSIVNTGGDDKVLRVRFRESRLGREVAVLNLYLARNDVWTAALVPSAQGTRLVTRDASCTDPSLGGEPSGIDFSDSAYSGANADGAGTGLDRTREGYIEVLEMATIAAGPSGAAVTHTAQGIPAACANVRPLPAADIRPPTGGISGTLTLINVADGSDYSMNAEALADLGTRAYYRPPADPYPAFEAAEIDPISVVITSGAIYRSHWSRAVDAVSGALMRHSAYAEYVIERDTRSHTDVVITLPTRPFLVGASASAPFTSPGPWSAQCAGLAGEAFRVSFRNRGQAGATLPSFFDGLQLDVDPPFMCAATAVVGVDNGFQRGSVLGSVAPGISNGFAKIRTGFEAGWLAFEPALRGAPGTFPQGSPSITSLPSSTRMDLMTGAVTAGAHTHFGLPMTGVVVRTLRNGTLSCAGNTCMGNYGAAFPLRYRRSISTSL